MDPGTFRKTLTHALKEQAVGNGNFARSQHERPKDITFVFYSSTTTRLFSFYLRLWSLKAVLEGL
jgi:hypothetical protein